MCEKKCRTVRAFISTVLNVIGTAKNNEASLPQALNIYFVLYVVVLLSSFEKHAHAS